MEREHERRTSKPSAPAPVLEERLRHQTSRFFGLVLVAVAFFAVALLAIGAGLAWVAVDNRANGDRLIECTTPSEPGDPHECFDDSQARTGDAIVVIVDEVDRRTCLRMEEALTTALARPIRLTCPDPAAPPTSTTPIPGDQP